MLRGTILAGGILIALMVSCREPRGACVWDASTAGPHCRDDGTKAQCERDAIDIGSSKFTPGKTCPAIGFACIGDAIDAAYRKTNPDGTCPPGSSKVTL